MNAILTNVTVSIVVQHVVESLSKLVSASLDLQLLSVDLVLNVVHTLVQLRDVHLAVLKPALRSLVLLIQVENLVLQLLLPLDSLLGRLLQLLHVLSDGLKLHPLDQTRRGETLIMV